MMEIKLFKKVHTEYEKFILLFHSENGQNFAVDLIVIRVFQNAHFSRINGTQNSYVHSKTF